jgi:hypothetical protein
MWPTWYLGNLYSGGVPTGPSAWIAAPRGLARLLVVLGLLIGLAVLQSTHCRDGFRGLAHVMMCPTTQVVGEDSGVLVHELVTEHGAVLYEAPEKDPHAPIGIAGLCLSVLVAVLLLMLGLAGPRLMGVVSLRAGLRQIVTRRRLGAPALAMLCVLRT